MKVYYYYIVLILWNICVNSVKSQWFYPTYYTVNPIYEEQKQETSYPTLDYSKTLPEYNGYSYQTKYEDGANSYVFFVTGPETSKFKNFPSFNNEISEKTNQARNFASNLLDSNNVNDPIEQLQSALKQNNIPISFNNVSPGVYYYYTSPGRSAPLVDKQNNIENNTTENETTTILSKVEGAESLQKNYRIPIIENNDSTKESTEMTTIKSLLQTFGKTFDEAVKNDETTVKNDETTVKNDETTGKVEETTKYEELATTLSEETTIKEKQQ